MLHLTCEMNNFVNKMFLRSPKQNEHSCVNVNVNLFLLSLQSKLRHAHVKPPSIIALHERIPELGIDYGCRSRYERVNTAFANTLSPVFRKS